MKQRAKYGLLRTMLIYYLLIGFAALMVGVEFVADTYSPQFRTQLLSKIEKYAKAEITERELFKPIDALRKKAILMIVVIMAVLIIVLTMFIRNIVEPLQQMIRVAEKISEGDLTQNIKNPSQNELAELGQVINEMTANLQEILLFSKNILHSGNEFIESTSDIASQKEIHSDQLKNLSASIATLSREFDVWQDFLACFNYYKFDKLEK